MPKHVSTEELEEIFSFAQTGATVERIAEVLKGRVSRRTLQRRLALLVSQRRLLREGAGRGSRYRVPMAESFRIAEEPPPERKFVELQLSTDARKIREFVRSAIHERRPVGYRRSFLEDYRPNETAYLPAELRRQLAAAGGTPTDDRPAGTRARQIFGRLLIDLSWNSCRLEGNTYSLLETERLLEMGQIAEGRNVRDARMILNHKAAIEFLVEQADETGFNRYTILNLHAMLAEELLSDPRAEGRLRTIPVKIGGTVYHPVATPQVVEECFDLILARASAIQDPFEQAFFALVHLPYLQPFEDVNKRVSRLAANIPLIRNNLCPISFLDLSERDYIDGVLGVYELNRIELLRDVFAWAYVRSCGRYTEMRRALGDPDPFRLRYRDALFEMVASMIRQGMNRDAAVRFLQTEASVRAARKIGPGWSKWPKSK